MKKYISLIILTITIASSSCKKNFLDLETNPNTPSVAAPNLILSGALKTSAALVNSTGYTMYASWMGYLSWSTGYQANTALEQYIITTSTYDDWTNYYLNLANYKALATSNSGAYYTAIATIMTVYNYEALVDNYNNVPYSQALGGVKNLTPTYDSGAAIYTDLMKQLDAAITLIQGAPTSTLNPGSADIVYSGNMTNWLKFANTLKLKLALREVNTNGGAGNPAFVSAVAATSSLGYIDATNPAQTQPGYLNSDANGGQQTPLEIAYGLTASGGGSGNNATYQANAYAAHFYGVNNDPRLDYVYSATNTADAANATKLTNASVDSVSNNPSYVVVSSPFGSNSPPQGTINGKTGNLGPSKFGSAVIGNPTAPAELLSSAESLFMQAEGVVRGYITGNAAALYNAGIASSFAYDGVPNAAAAAATYSGQANILYPTGGSTDAQVKAIIVQKWAALNLYGAFEAFNEFRRTGYPDNIPLSIYAGANAPNQVTRIPYPFVEYATNASNVSAQGTINIFTSKIFWAK